MKSIAIVVLLLFSFPAFAETYKWVDSHGTVNYADDLGKVPPKYRKKAKRIGGGDAAPVEVTEVKGAGGKGKTEGDATAPPQAQTQGKKKVYGGRSEEDWKNRFSSLRGPLQNVEVQIEDRKQRLSDPSTMSRAQYLGIQSELRSFEAQRGDLMQKLNALNAEADQANVPRDLRN